MASKGECLDSLKKVIDPEIGINIVDVGLIYRIEPSEDGSSVEVDFTLTSPGCPLGDYITQEIVRVLQEDHGFSEIQPNLVWNPPWSMDFMSEDARLELGLPI
jgi:metal-sulfur cluster biosynthetic enzyme